MWHLRDEELPAARSLLRRVKIQVDPMWRGELRRLAADPRLRKSYFSRRGLPLDRVGEALWSAGYLVERPDINETLEVIAYVMSASSPRADSLPVRICQSVDERPFTKRDLRTWLSISPDVDLGRALRRLRPLGFTVSRQRIRGRTHYRVTRRV